MVTIENMIAFAAKGDVRTYLHRPFLDSGRWVSTNGHILISVPGDTFAAGAFDHIPGGWTPPPEAVLKSAPKILEAAFERATEFEACPPPEAYEVDGPCPDCNGTGECECDMGYEHKCDRCYGEGTAQAPEHPQPWHTAHFASKYIAAIHALPDAKLAIPVAPDVGLAFTCEGDGRGVVMPIKL